MSRSTDAVAGVPRTSRSTTTRRSDRLRLFVVPHAGAGIGSALRLAAALPDDIDVIPFRLPGRESRFREPPVTSSSVLVDELADIVRDSGQGKVWILGTCSGAFVAMALTQALVERGRPADGTILLGPPVGEITGPARALEDVSSAALWRQLESTGIPAQIAVDPELRALFEPVLRADLMVARELWSCSQKVPATATFAVRGADDAVVDAAQFTSWAARVGVTALTTPGSHLLLDGGAEQIGAIARVVAGLMASR
jgi:medium-chain acyl-[acyl-carrier-protein] hydrolase